MSTIAEIQDAIEKLPAREKEALSTWLSEKADQLTGTKRQFRFDWEGSFADAFPGMTSVDLQHQANVWR